MPQEYVMEIVMPKLGLTMTENMTEWLEAAR